MREALYIGHAIIQAEQMTVDYPRTSAGFQCFVCGTRFDSNEERIEHLEKGSHGSMYDTG
ncbi:MAG: hypothetical protein ACR2IS_15225 [Nitrososphaeraceae archaeon]